VTSCVVTGGIEDTENEIVVAGVEVVLCTVVEVAAGDDVNACAEAVLCDCVTVEGCCVVVATSCVVVVVVVVAGTVVMVCTNKPVDASVDDKSVVVAGVVVVDGNAITQ
jgi:hypothetical protein